MTRWSTPSSASRSRAGRRSLRSTSWTCSPPRPSRPTRTHGDLLNLVAGQPSTPAPVPVREAAKRALDQEVLGYTVALGIPELREAIAGHHRRMHGLDVGIEDVVVTTGSSAASCWRSWPRSSPGTASRSRGPATPATATC